MKLCDELMPVLRQLQSEGFDVYTYTTQYNPPKEYHSLYWFEDGRLLNIQPSTWRNERYNRDLFFIGVSYIPSQQNGSGCSLMGDNDWGLSACDLLKYRREPTWVRGVKNYRDMSDFLKRETILKFCKLDSNGNA